MQRDLLAAISIIAFLPHLIYVTLNQNSLASGLLVSIIISTAFLLSKYELAIKNKQAIYLITLISIIWAHWIYSTINTDNIKAISIFPLIIIMICCAFVGSALDKLDYDEILGIFRKLSIACIIIGWLGYFKIGLIGPYKDLPKGIFPFREYSHFALVGGTFLFIISYHLNFRRFFIIAINYIVLSILLPSFSLLIFSILSITLHSLRYNFKKIIILLCFITVIIIFIINFIDLSYFTDRLDTNDNSNATTLVWLQGWELIIENLQNSNWLGIGFQNLGHTGITKTNSTELIVLLAGTELNIEDGGFLAAKIISEFGIIGLIPSIYIIYRLISQLFISKKTFFSENESIANATECKENFKNIIFLSCLTSIFVEFYIRGVGYFSPGIAISLIGFFSFNSQERNYNDHL